MEKRNAREKNKSEEKTRPGKAIVRTRTRCQWRIQSKRW